MPTGAKKANDAKRGEKMLAVDLFREDTIRALHVRRMTFIDVEEVLQLENATFRPAWNRRDFRAAVSERDAICLVATLETSAGTLLVGYAVSGRQRGKSGHPGEMYLIRMAVNHEFRRLGIGSYILYEAVHRRLSLERLPVAYTSVRETDLESQKWLSANGWICTAIEGDSLAFVFREEWRGLE